MHLVGHNHVEKYYKRKHTPGVPKNFGLACVLTTPFALFRLPTNVWIMQLGVLWRTPMCTYEQCGLCIRRVHCLSRGVIIHKWVFCAGVSLLEEKNGGVGCPKSLMPPVSYVVPTLKHAVPTLKPAQPACFYWRGVPPDLSPGYHQPPRHSSSFIVNINIKK